tara:strand:+ start:7209 stop:7520 length:312 start_codon:yes stop_codon:yes gene_type:complete
MIKKEKDREEALKALESALPGFIEHLKSHCEEDGAQFEESLVSLFTELKKFQEEYPHISDLCINSFEMLRAHGERLEILKDVLLSVRGVEEVEIPTTKDKYLN